MKNYFSNRIAFVATLLLTSVAMNGCSNYKAAPELNVYHPNIYATYGQKVNLIKGILCTKSEFVNNSGSDKTQLPMLSIVLDEGYSRYVTGGIYDFNKERTEGLIAPKKITTNLAFQQECGVNKKYPIIHEFIIDLGVGYSNGKGKEAHMKEYYEIVNQIKQKKYLDVRAIIVPMVATSIEGSAQDARMYFTDEQVAELFRKKE